jgi:twitching motility protein PilT
MQTRKEVVMTDSTRTPEGKSLPANPSLKHLRNEAKELLQARKQKNPDAPIGLQECQHALAQNYGFKNWSELKSHVESMSSTGTDDARGRSTCKHPLFERALREAVDRKASDVHIVAGEPLTFRVKGEIERSEGDVISPEEMLAASTAQFGDDVAERVESTGGVQAGCSVAGLTKGQATATMSSGSIRVAITLVSKEVLDYTQTGMPQGLLDVASQKSGLVVFAGQDGSGFKTSATSFIDYINQTQPVHILTIEDPVRGEIVPKRAVVQQREVGTDTPDIVSAMRIGVGQDVDVLYVAALRATQELVSAITAAEMGKLVVIPVHGNSFDEVMERIVSAFPAGDRPAYRKRLARILRAISVQTLLARKDKPGRVAAYGVLIPDESVMAAVEKGESLNDLDELPVGSQLMDSAIVKLREDGIID